MRTFSKLIVATLVMTATLGIAHAGDPLDHPENRALHRAIAMQGDQALYIIHSSTADLISQSIRSQLVVSLPVYDIADDVLRLQGMPASTDLTEVAATH